LAERGASAAGGNRLKIRRALDWLVIPCLAFLGAAAWGNVPSADIVILHARVYTENPGQPWAEALAVSGENIAAVGTNREIAEYRGAHTQTVDARGRVVLPGFTDSHIHFLEGSLTLDKPDLNGARSILDVQHQLKAYASAHPGDGWIFGQGWTYDVFDKSALPDKQSLDKLFPSRPVYLESYDGHTAWVNSKALSMAGIERQTPDPADGKIIRDPRTGEPTGALEENARHLVRHLIPQPTREEKLEALRKGLLLANQYGVVRMHAAGEPPDTFGDFYDLDLFDQLRGNGQLTVRLYISKDIEPPELRADDLSLLEQARRHYHDEWISVGAAKFFVDGAIESHTGAMLAPYHDEPKTSGSTLWAPEKLREAVLVLDHLGFQIFAHAVGDRAVRLTLDAYESAELKNGRADLRHRIEHIETISAEDLPRFAKLGVIASMQPLHAYPSPNTGVWIRHVGPEREKLAWAWHSLASAEARLAFGSDWEVVTMNPWPGVQTAVTRQDDNGQPPGGWVPEQRISVSQAIAAYTIGAAYAGHREGTEGSIEAGKLADLIIVSQNPFEVDPHELRKTRVELTMVGGRVVYQQPSGPVGSGKKNQAGEKSHP
jgi:predicted amidohydrolase YtcJ